MRIICALFLCLFSTMAFANVVIEGMLTRPDNLHLISFDKNANISQPQAYSTPITLYINKRSMQTFKNINLNNFCYVRTRINLSFISYDEKTKEYKAKVSFSPVAILGWTGFNNRSEMFNVDTFFPTTKQSEIMLEGKLKHMSMADNIFNEDMKLTLSLDDKKILLLLSRDIPVNVELKNIADSPIKE